MRATAHTNFYTPAGSDSVMSVLQQITAELKTVDWRVVDRRAVAFSTRRTLFAGSKEVRVVATPLAIGSDVRIVLHATPGRSTREATTRRAIERLSARIQSALI